MPVIVTVLVAFLLAFAMGTLVEYLLHRYFLHARSRNFVTRRHRLHHKSNEADTLWGDFRDFLPGMVPFGWLGFMHSPTAGIAFLLGLVAYVFVLALVHKLSHERPRLIFWMSTNAHDLHHDGTPCANFGIVTRFWDVVFGTYTNDAPKRERKDHVTTIPVEPSNAKSEFPLRPIEVLSVLAAMALVVTHLVRFVLVPELCRWPTLIAILIGLLVADLVSGLLHWIGDTWGSEHSRGFGMRFIRPFRFHHAHPLDMLKSNFFTTNGDTALGSLPFLLMPFAFPLSHPIGLLAAVICWTIGALGMWTSQFHKWAHMKSPPRVAAWFQRRGLILSAVHHRRHHKVPFAENYCITTGWCNPVLERIRLFPALEWVISRLTGLRPRGDQHIMPALPVRETGYVLADANNPDHRLSVG